MIKYILIILCILIILLIAKLNNRERNYQPQMEEKLVENRIIHNNDNGRKIPKNIVQSLNCKRVTKKLYQNIEKVKKLNPDYNYEFFTEKESIDFINEHFGENYSKAYIKLYCGAFRADFFRYCYLYIKGGFWIDVFMDLIYPLDKLLDKDYNFITCLDLIDKNNVKEQSMIYEFFIKKFVKIDKTIIYNAFLGFEPKNEIIKKVLDKSYENIINGITGDLNITGPELFGKIIDETNLEEYEYKFFNFKLQNIITKFIKREDYKLDNGIFDKGKKIITNKYPGHEKDKNIINNKNRNGKKIYNENINFIEEMIKYNKYFYENYEPNKKNIIYTLTNKELENLNNIKINKNENHIIFNNFEETQDLEKYKKLKDIGFLLYFNSFKIKDNEENIKVYLDELVNNKEYKLISNISQLAN